MQSATASPRRRKMARVMEQLKHQPSTGAKPWNKTVADSIKNISVFLDSLAEKTPPEPLAVPSEPSEPTVRSADGADAKESPFVSDAGSTPNGPEEDSADDDRDVFIKGIALGAISQSLVSNHNGIKMVAGRRIVHVAIQQSTPFTAAPTSAALCNAFKLPKSVVLELVAGSSVKELIRDLQDQLQTVVGRYYAASNSAASAVGVKVAPRPRVAVLMIWAKQSEFASKSVSAPGSSSPSALSGDEPVAMLDSVILYPDTVCAQVSLLS